MAATAMSAVVLLLLLVSEAAAISTMENGGGGNFTLEVEKWDWRTHRHTPDHKPCDTGNPIDDCWRCDPRWHLRRRRLADCAVGFGAGAIGGRDGRFYVVADPGDYDVVNPRVGTLRHGVLLAEPLWIVFKHDMRIVLKEELIMMGHKTIDGRGAEVHITGGGCITVQGISNVIIHGVHIHGCKQAGNTIIRDSPWHFGHRGLSDGDGISIVNSTDIWVDHCSLSSCRDGLIDSVEGSTGITVSNNLFTNHNEVMLFGHNDNYTRDVNQRASIVFNRFGEGLVQRMPRVRFGKFHIMNNDYTYWKDYAIGGSANATIYSEGNRFTAPRNRILWQVTKRINTKESVWKNWNWKSEGDLMLNGAYFMESGSRDPRVYRFDKRCQAAKPASMVGTITADAGALKCRLGVAC